MIPVEWHNIFMCITISYFCIMKGIYPMCTWYNIILTHDALAYSAHGKYIHTAMHTYIVRWNVAVCHEYCCFQGHKKRTTTPTDVLKIILFLVRLSSNWKLVSIGHSKLDFSFPSTLLRNWMRAGGPLPLFIPVNIITCTAKQQWIQQR